MISTGEAAEEPKDSEQIDDVDDATAERTRPRRRVIFSVLGAILAFVVLFYGVKWYLFARVHAGTTDARIDANDVLVNSKIAERINAILVDANEPVKKGQLLVVLDDRGEISRLKQADAQYHLALATQQTTTQQGIGGVASARAGISDSQAQVSLAQAGVASAQAAVRSAAAQLPAARANEVKAQANLARVASLVSTGDLPAEDLDAQRAASAAAAAQSRAARQELAMAQANLAAARQRVGAATAGVGSSQGVLQTAQGRLAQSKSPSQVESAKAALQLAKQQLDYTRIYSPINGYVGERSAEVGQVVGPGTTLLTLIPSQKNIFITANYKETAVGDMHPGQTADITVDAYPGKTFHGRVLSINPASQNTYALIPVQNATGNFVKVTQRIPVRISIVGYNTKKYPMRPGMSVETYVKVR
ncbi:MAG: HlyD family secretion protein [Vulcanimicrobiaceae bacterium]